MRSGVKFHFNKQSGVALLILVITIVFAALAYAFSGISITEIKLEQTKKTLKSLKQAKQAVIAYAVTRTERAGSEGEFGFLPCTETFKNGDYGNMSGTCAAKNTNSVNWFPWRSLDMPALKDESGTCLFYAVSGTYKLGPEADMINEDSIGMFQIINGSGDIIKGANIEDRIVALVIAPGDALTGQARNPLKPESNCGDDYGNVSAYLEGDGATNNSTVTAATDTIDQFIHATEASATEAEPYNDKFLTITRDEIWDAIVTRADFKQKMENLTQALAMCLREYALRAGNDKRRLPWPAYTDLGATTNYRVNVSYTDQPNAPRGYSGRYPYQLGDSNIAIFGAINPNILFDIPGLCDNLDLTGSGAGTTVDFRSNLPLTEYRKLYNNWKDHIFYILSRGSRPDDDGDNECEDESVCIRVNGTRYAGAVIFSGRRLDGVTRNDKSEVADYLEDGKSALFINEEANRTGDLNYTYSDPDDDPNFVNDIMYCIPRFFGPVIECAIP